MGSVIDGKAVAAKVRGEVREAASVFAARHGRPPGLAAVLVGDDPASARYVASKEKAGAEVGIAGKVVRLPADIGEDALARVVDSLNADPIIDGFIVQLPLPPGIDASRILDRIDPAKDVDGLHPNNLGLLVAGRPGLVPCTPLGCLRLLDEHGVDARGKHAVVLGRSNIVGKPVALLLLERHATVTICHSRTADLAAEVGRADIVVAAIGKAEMVKGAWLKPGAVVIDVGINRNAAGKLVGDVEYAPALERAAAITPVPGGVGPMTVAYLMHNTVQAARARLSPGAARTGTT
ncbi:MAG: bifunctional methylenetetrahydrofolate dehydrogenase/methenyltetrahydrofolate cyclohydrolase FolD [Deltaproteobacteria bacterium]|nr:bifunctional methylenetetrahydrofolate dehydrogenase/methenyltetrahydrofolate cyclohydrolase FolD [Deltaproteobacteria bacterium]